MSLVLQTFLKNKLQNKTQLISFKSFQNALLP